MGDDQVPADRDACDDLNADWQPGDPIAYINPEAPAATVPPYRGERYEALEPEWSGTWAFTRRVALPASGSLAAPAVP